MKSVFIILVLAWNWSSAESQMLSKCYDQQLIRAGFIIHPSNEFSQLEEALQNRMEHDQHDSNGDFNYHFAGQGSLQSVGNSNIFQYLIIDDVRTPESIMYGDAVYLRDQPYPNGQKVEIRWYENNLKHIVFKHACALVGPSQSVNKLLL